ncbi:unnamed protein product [Owenia fusiformis]|uniref:Secernin-3 n=1 Tax=Owenia fusiformis TaxID=6347 RepID=A0A8S4P8N0_OWEFU|nr:unnamed protein product [Owenia fusiformis]
MFNNEDHTKQEMTSEASFPAPKSCDTFVALPPATSNGAVIFGKNSDRPMTEVQEVVYVPSKDHADDEKLECTYISIDQVKHTNAVILSKPSWLWGAEMGSNEHGVCIGNEAVWTKPQSDSDLDERLLGMDLVRLGLERGATAKEALDVITGLLAKYGQGGPCAEGDQWSYHNSFLISDKSVAWVLETAGEHWAAEKITSGVRNISNELSIRTKIDAMSDGLKEHAKSNGYWDGEGEFDFANVYSSGGVSDLPSGRYGAGKALLEKLSKGGEFGTIDMFKILRDEESGICMTGAFLSTGSQVSVVPGPDSNSPSCHWFTATPNPQQSIFKPFVFCEGSSIGENTTSPSYGAEDPVKIKPRFAKTVDRKHPLYKLQKQMRSLLDRGDEKAVEMLKNMLEMETHCVADTEEVLRNFDASNTQKNNHYIKECSGNAPL